MNACEVKWCVALPRNSTFCAPHEVNPLLKPTELEPDEELMFPGMRCTGCKADGVCTSCKGKGYTECECRTCGNMHDADCEKCDRTGQCDVCKGTGNQEVRKKPEAA